MVGLCWLLRAYVRGGNTCAVCTDVPHGHVLTSSGKKQCLAKAKVEHLNHYLSGQNLTSTPSYYIGRHHSSPTVPPSMVPHSGPTVPHSGPTVPHSSL